jgi:hypothetical protein
MHLAAMGGRIERLQKLWEWANEKLTTEEIKINCYKAQTMRECPSGAWQQTTAV